MARKGLPKAIIKKYGISKKAWSVYRGGKKSSSRSSKLTKRSKKNNPKRRKTTMARRKRRRGARKFTLPLAPILGIAAGTNAWGAWNNFARGEFADGIEKVTAAFTGYSTKSMNWEPTRLMHGLLPTVIGIMVHKFVGGPPLNLNRSLASAGVPFLRI